MALQRFRARALSLILRSLPNMPASQPLPVVSLNRLLCSAATTTSSVSSPTSFAAEDFLVTRCGLTRDQAVKASKRISHFSSSSQPEAVLSFLGGTLGVPAVDVAALIALDPSILCADVERTVAPRIAELSDLGLSRGQIARLIPLAPNSFRSRFLRRNVEFWLKELGSFDKLLVALRMNTALLTTDLDKVAAPNVAFLRECGLNASEIIDLGYMHSARLFTMNSKRLREDVERVEELGIKRGEGMFRYGLISISLMNKEALPRTIQLLQKFGFSKDDVLEMVRIAPLLLGLSDKKVQGNMDFLMKDVGLDISYMVRRPALLMYSVERRLLPRHWLLKVLREKGLMNTEVTYYSTATMSEKLFLQKYVLPYEDAVPGLAADYASKCSGKAVGRVASQEK